MYIIYIYVIRTVPFVIVCRIGLWKTTHSTFFHALEGTIFQLPTPLVWNSQMTNQTLLQWDANIPP